MSEQRAPYCTGRPAPATVQIRLSGSPAEVAATVAWLQAAGLDVREESGDRPSRKVAGSVLRYLVATVPKM